MKTVSVFFILLSTVLSVCCLPSRAGAAAAYAVADGVSGHLLATHHGDERLPIASLTKIATAMVVIDWAEHGKEDLGQRIVVPSSVLRLGGANPVGFDPGDQVSMRDLLYAALLQSDNRAAHTLAEHVGRRLAGRSRQDEATPGELFVAQMNALARKLGMTRTRFLNPHGLDHEESPFSTANDLVRLTNYAMARSSFRFYVSQKQRRIQRNLPDGGMVEYLLVNTNDLLGSNGVDGVKTGRTRKAGDCLILSAARPPESVPNPDGTHTITPRRLVVVVLGSGNRFAEGGELLQRGWRLYDEWAARGRPTGKNKN